MNVDAYFIQGFSIGVRVDFGLMFAEVGLGMLCLRVSWVQATGEVTQQCPVCGEWFHDQGNARRVMQAFKAWFSEHRHEDAAPAGEERP